MIFRPSCPPEKPLTLAEILNNIYQHFVVGKAPQSRQPTLGGSRGLCQYGMTGCAIGCMVDLKTADRWDGIGSVKSILATHSVWARETFNRYFDGVNPDDLSYLQEAHDGWSTARKRTLGEHMLLAINEVARRNNLPEFSAPVSDADESAV